MELGLIRDMQTLLEIKVVEVFKDLQARLLITSLLLRGKFGPAAQRGAFKVIYSIDIHVVFPE